MRQFKNIDDAVFGFFLCLTGLVGLLLLAGTVYYSIVVGNSIGTPHYPRAISCFAALLVVVVFVRIQLQRDTLRWWSYLAFVGACAWASITNFTDLVWPVHDAIHLLGIEDHASPAYVFVALIPLLVFGLTALFAVIRWFASNSALRNAWRQLIDWATTYERTK